MAAQGERSRGRTGRWLTNAMITIDRTTSSPNHSSRGGHTVSLIVLHATAGSLASSRIWLCNPKSRVSIHYLISKTGHIEQLVDEAQAAWHAGAASWHGESAINEISVGVELENANDGHDPYPPTQLHAAHELVGDIVARHSVTHENLVRHLDVAIPHGRKSDPAGFPWAEFVAGVFGQVPEPVVRRYRVVSGLPARIREQPSIHSAQLGSLPAGEDAQQVEGVEVLGDVYADNALWVRLVGRKGYVWRGLLEPSL